MTAPFPTRKQEEWRYADLDALRPVWEQYSNPATLVVAAGEALEDIWIPSADEVQIRRVTLALGKGARTRIFALNIASHYGRIELDVSLAAGADFELYGANIGNGSSANEIVTNIRHLEKGGRSRQISGRHLSRQNRGRARSAADRCRTVGEGDAPGSWRDRQLQAGARNFRR
jgi:Fe-S cluster assembly protein SufD